MAISVIFNRSYLTCWYYSSDRYGHAAICGALWLVGRCDPFSPVWFAALLAVNDGIPFQEDIIEYSEKAKLIKQLFISNGFRIVYDRIWMNLADGSISRWNIRE